MIVVSLFITIQDLMKSLIAVAAIFASTFAVGQEIYRVSIDLTEVSNDQVPVTISVPKITRDLVEYHMAKVVPGTYSISDFGRFVTDFKALDGNGKSLNVTVATITNCPTLEKPKWSELAPFRRSLKTRKRLRSISR